jgi:hypothetical protein
VKGAPLRVNFVPDVLTNPVAVGPAGVEVVVVEVTVLLVLVLVLIVVLEPDTVLVPLPTGRHWKKKSFKTVHTKGAAQTAEIK